MNSPYPWQFPAPVKRSAFLPWAPEWSAWNIETDLSSLPSFEFTKEIRQDVLWFDFHTTLDGNSRGRLGSGRGGQYRGYYVKGLGRTPAAANWNDLEDRYHGTGHMAAGQVLREYLISRTLERRGLNHQIVPCETFLVQPLTREHSRQIARLRTKRQTYRPPADQSWMALSLKPANFGRHANFVWALHHSSSHARHLGDLFLTFESLLASPSDRQNVSGDPKSITMAMEAAILRGFDNFLKFTEIGLFWIYLQNNVTLDGRFLDLETPLFFDRPFIGKLVFPGTEEPGEQLLGFECFAWIALWRRFFHWLDSQLELLSHPGYFDHAQGSVFVKELRCVLRRHFHRRSFLFDDEAARSRALSRLSQHFEKTRHLKQISIFAGQTAWYGLRRAMPKWQWMPAQWAAPSPSPVLVECPAFAGGPLGSEAVAFASKLEQAGRARDLNSVKLALRETAATDFKTVRAA